MSSHQTTPAGGTVSKDMVQELSGELTGSTALWIYPVYTSKTLRSFVFHHLNSRSIACTETEKNGWKNIPNEDDGSMV